MKNIAKLLGLVALGVALPLAGCNDPLTVKTPDIVPPSALNDTSALATLRAGAIGDFSIAYTGDHPDGSGGTAEGVILYGGLLADEFIDSETFPTRIEVDARTIHLTNIDVDLWYRLLHRARNSAEIAADAYRRLRPTDPGNPEVLNLSGYTYVFFAETFCSGVPVSHLNADGTITYGTPLTTVALLDTAIARFDSAISLAKALDSTGSLAAVRTEMIQLGSIGKARALLFRAGRPGGQLGDLAAAAALAATVPTTFAYSQEHTTTTDRENNGVFNAGATDGRYSVADGEGVNGFPFRTNPDTADRRTSAVLDPGQVGFDGSTPLWDNLRYGSRTTPITVATGVEARLIEAENSLATGDFTGFFTHLNEPRENPAERSYFNPNPFDRTNPGTAATGVLSDLTAADTVTAGSAVGLLFAERARWLWLTAHRLGDLRRLIVQHGKTQNQVFPVGPYFKGQPPTYGVDVNLPVPVTEQNNPNFTACLDRLP